MGDLVYFSKYKNHKSIKEDKEMCEYKQTIQRRNLNPEQAAKYIRSELSLTESYLIPIVKIAEKMGFSVLTGSSVLDDSTSGVIAIDTGIEELYGNNKCIFVNEDRKEGKQRFVIAHELGHYLFDYNGENEFYRAYDKNEIANYDAKERKCENLANQFAANILVDDELFMRDYNLFYSTNIDVAEIANNFGVTKKCIDKRLKELIIT